VSLAVPAFAGDAALDALLKGVETRYNKTKTLQVLFHEDYTPPGRAKRSESGTLALRKPGKMRWDYDQPKGKLFVSDGKFLWLYTPDGNRAERMKLKESDDMRAPLAFLLGKLTSRRSSAICKRSPKAPTRGLPPSRKPTTCPIPPWNSWSPRTSTSRESR